MRQNKTLALQIKLLARYLTFEMQNLPFVTTGMERLKAMGEFF